MTAKEYLEYVRSLDTRLRIKELEITQLRNDICSIQALDYSKDKITGGSPIDVSDKIARLDELIRRTNAEWDELIDKREEARRLILELPSAKQQELLRRRYLRGEKWEHMAVEMGCTWQNLYALHRRALRSFEKILKKVAVF